MEECNSVKDVDECIVGMILDPCRDKVLHFLEADCLCVGRFDWHVRSMVLTGSDG